MGRDGIRPLTSRDSYHAPLGLTVLEVNRPRSPQQGHHSRQCLQLTLACRKSLCPWDLREDLPLPGGPAVSQVLRFGLSHANEVF